MYAYKSVRDGLAYANICNDVITISIILIVMVYKLLR